MSEVKGLLMLTRGSVKGVAWAAGRQLQVQGGKTSTQWVKRMLARTSEQSEVTMFIGGKRVS